VARVAECRQVVQSVCPRSGLETPERNFVMHIVWPTDLPRAARLTAVSVP
jgi:hypothetical protein